MRIMPCVEVESAYGTSEVALATRHLNDGSIFLTGIIDSDMANEFLSQFLWLENWVILPINVYINSPGGDINAGLMIYDVMQLCPRICNIICTGMAGSMAAIILAGGQKNRRFIMEHSKVMIHEPLISGGVGGSATSIQNISTSILETREICNGLLAGDTGKSLEEINKATSFDNYMNAEEAVKFGICDKIITDLDLFKDDEYVQSII